MYQKLPVYIKELVLYILIHLRYLPCQNHIKRLLHFRGFSTSTTKYQNYPKTKRAKKYWNGSIHAKSRRYLRYISAILFGFSAKTKILQWCQLQIPRLNHLTIVVMLNDHPCGVLCLTPMRDPIQRRLSPWDCEYLLFHSPWDSEYLLFHSPWDCNYLLCFTM